MSCAEPEKNPKTSSAELSGVDRLHASIENQLKVKDEQLRKNSELLDRYVQMLEERDRRIQELYGSLMELT